MRGIIQSLLNESKFWGMNCPAQSVAGRARYQASKLTDVSVSGAPSPEHVPPCSPSPSWCRFPGLRASWTSYSGAICNDLPGHGNVMRCQHIGVLNKAPGSHEDSVTCDVQNECDYEGRGEQAKGTTGVSCAEVDEACVERRPGGVFARLLVITRKLDVVTHGYVFRHGCRERTLPPPQAASTRRPLARLKHLSAVQHTVARHRRLQARLSALSAT